MKCFLILAMAVEKTQVSYLSLADQQDVLWQELTVHIRIAALGNCVHIYIIQEGRERGRKNGAATPSRSASDCGNERRWPREGTKGRLLRRRRVRLGDVLEELL